jgi:hypothetical protein
MPKYVVTETCGPELYFSPVEAGDEVDLTEEQAEDPLRRGVIRRREAAKTAQAADADVAQLVAHAKPAKGKKADG